MRITMRDVSVAAVLTGGLECGELMGRGRVHSVILVRQAAQWLCARRVGPSISQTGRFFKRDHTTVINSIRCVEERLEREPENGPTRTLIDEIWAKALDVAKNDIRLNVEPETEVKMEPKLVVERSKVSVSAVPVATEIPRKPDGWVIKPPRHDDHFEMYRVL
jgi:hypothetical protein